MEINKQLFEDVLSGKLKGKFIQKDGKNLDDKLLTSIDKFTVVLNGKTFYFNGKPTIDYYDGILDIVDFIPKYHTIDLEMLEYCRKDFEFMQTLSKAINNMNTLEIEIPEGKEIDWKQSEKQNKIVLKDKPNLSYGDVCHKLFGNQQRYHIIHDGRVEVAGLYNCDIEPNAAKTRHQLECILAKNMLANVAKYLNDGWKPDKNCNGHFDAWVLYLTSNNDIGYGMITNCCENNNILFKSFELAQQAIKILGEETVKLALEPLGI